MSRTLLTNAVLTDADGARQGALLVQDGVIQAVFDSKDAPHSADKDDVTLDCGGHTLLPAFIDMHTHLRDPGYTQKETLLTGMRAALKGGYATLCAMANTLPVCETPAMIEENHARAKAIRLCHLIQCGAAGVGLKDETPTDWAALSKVTKVLSNDGQTIFSDGFMRELLLASKEYGFIISTHCQPERRIVRRDLELLAQVGGNLHIGHISRLETLSMIREAKKSGLSLTCEVTPHHLFGYGMGYKVNPPLRTKADVQALIEGAADGSIDCLSTDHAPHTPQDKAAGMAGISNIEYAAQIFLKVFTAHGIPLTRLSQMASATPAKRLSLNAGLLKHGMRADLTLLDPDAESVIDPSAMLSKSHNTPFGGQAVQGQILWTMVEGEIRYEHG